MVLGMKVDFSNVAVNKGMLVSVKSSQKAYLVHICRATTRPPRPWLTAECLRLIARLRET